MCVAAKVAKALVLATTKCSNRQQIAMVRKIEGHALGLDASLSFLSIS